MYHILRSIRNLFRRNKKQKKQSKKKNQNSSYKEKDKYIFSSIYPNEQIMNEVDYILRKEKKGA